MIEKLKILKEHLLAFFGVIFLALSEIFPSFDLVWSFLGLSFLIAQVYKMYVLREKRNKKLADEKKKRYQIIKSLPDDILGIMQNNKLVNLKEDFESSTPREASVDPGVHKEILSHFLKHKETNSVNNTYEFYNDTLKKHYEVSIFSQESEYKAIVVLRDVTEKRTHQSQLDEKNTLLENSSRLAALGEMAGGVAHEINNPLQILALTTEQLKMFMEFDDINKEACVDLLSQIESTVERIDGIVQGMKLISRDASKDSFEIVDVKEIVDKTLKLSKEKFKNQNVNLVSYVDEGNHLIFAQKVQLSQVLLNLLNNAYDAIDQNENKIIRIYLFEKDGKVQLSVSDNGPGVPTKIKEKIFQPFFTTKSIGKGTGLGLSISKSIVEERHGGKFYLDDTDNSKFILELPLYEDQEELKHVS